MVNGNSPGLPPPFFFVIHFNSTIFTFRRVDVFARCCWPWQPRHSPCGGKRATRQASELGRAPRSAPCMRSDRWPPHSSGSRRGRPGRRRFCAGGVRVDGGSPQKGGGGSTIVHIPTASFHPRPIHTTVSAHRISHPPPTPFFTGAAFTQPWARTACTPRHWRRPRGPGRSLCPQPGSRSPVPPPQSRSSTSRRCQPQPSRQPRPPPCPDADRTPSVWQPRTA